MAKGSYTVVRRRRHKDRTHHALLLHDPNGITLCGVDANGFCIAETKDSVDCENCAAMIVDMVREARKRRGKG